MGEIYFCSHSINVSVMAKLMLEQRAMSVRCMSLFFICWKNSVLSKQSQKIASCALSSLHATLKDCKGHRNASCSAWQFVLLVLKHPIYFFKLYVTSEISWKLFCYDPDCHCSSLCGLMSFSPLQGASNNEGWAVSIASPFRAGITFWHSQDFPVLIALIQWETK